ncbi:MAG TPA: hypothetical protein VMK12_20505, partial [Anaeromyxobacteraceae bacterium]|nr:hypothetical protein [Anaeromyxobacteraceae bacterium]
AEESERAPRGLAVFACEALKLWRVLTTSQPFRDELCLDGCPHLLQLARLADDVEPAIIAFVHAEGVHFYEVALGDIVNEAAVEPRAPGASGSEMHRVEGEERKQHLHRERTFRAAAQFLERLHERAPRAHIVLVGTGEVVAAFEKHLSERARHRVLARQPRPPGKGCWNGNGKRALVARAVDQIVAHERAAEAGAVEHAVGEALRGGMAVLGPEDVVLAVNERRVQRLILEEDFARSGWSCRNCGALGTTHGLSCSFCQGPLARVEALGEELIQRVLSEDGDVEVVAHTNRLHSYAGVAALLRQMRPRGLSGIEQPARPE